MGEGGLSGWPREACGCGKGAREWKRGCPSDGWRRGPLSVHSGVKRQRQGSLEVKATDSPPRGGRIRVLRGRSWGESEHTRSGPGTAQQEHVKGKHADPVPGAHRGATGQQRSREAQP